MRVAITADVPREDTPISMVFGRCPYYAIYDSESDKIDFVPNPGGMTARGAGVQAGQFLIEQGVSVLITAGAVGPNASMVLGQAGIQVISGFQGTIRDAVSHVKNNDIKAVPRAPIPPQNYGYNTMAMGYIPQLTPEEEIKMLEEEESRIKERLDEIKKRLEELENR